MKENLKSFFKKDSVKSVLASLISILVGLVVGAIAVFLVGIFKDTIGVKGAWEGVRLIFIGILSTGRDALGSLTWGYNAVNLGDMLFRATPLIMAGLSVSVAFKTGLFNIGAPGQYLMGTMVALSIALSIPSDKVPAWIIWIIAFLAAMLAGALWGAIPGFVKAVFNINEVIACIMTNWIAANLVTWFFDGSVFCNQVEAGKTG
ncbi:MAG: ABC transporter permease, partial [Lachnospiraceae bacterium]|nr:ABC transporter permease [Lachnospiraceae bacterium]